MSYLGHEWVYTGPRVLHRDISHGNIMFRRKSPDGPVYGVLNDFDLATMLDDPRPTPSSNHRTGTLPFMAHEQHADSWDGPLRFRHDLESLFYVMLLLTCHYTKPGVRARELLYGSWYEIESNYLGKEKLALILAESWSPPVETFFEGFVPWLKHIKKSLWKGFLAFSFHKVQRDSDDGESDALWEQETPSKIIVSSFDEETLNGNFSYQTFFNVMWAFKGQTLETRNPQLVRVRKTA